MIYLIQHRDLGIEMFTVFYELGDGRWHRPGFTSEIYARRFIQLNFKHIDAAKIPLIVAKLPIFSHNLYSEEVILLGNPKNF